MINKLENLVEEGIMSQEEFNSWVDPDFYTEISKIIQQVVTVFKLVICSDKTMNKTIDKVINNRANNSSASGLGSNVSGGQQPPNKDDKNVNNA